MDSRLIAKVHKNGLRCDGCWVRLGAIAKIPTNLRPALGSVISSTQYLNTMPTITVSEKQKTDNGFEATLSRSQTYWCDRRWEQLMALPTSWGKMLVYITFWAQALRPYSLTNFKLRITRF
ncbi:MAG: hypothetical protein AB4426_06105 [Xenococcaceae cyanobacterium]